MDLNKELEIALGLRSGEFKSYKTLRVDNGDDKKAQTKRGSLFAKQKMKTALLSVSNSARK